MSELAKTVRLLRLWERELETNESGWECVAPNRVFCLRAKAIELFSLN